MSPPAICCGTTPSLVSTWPAKPPMRILRPLRSATVLISLRYQPPICAPVLPHRIARDAVALEELVVELLAAAEVPPRVVLALVEAERDRGAERERRVLADVVVRRGVAALDGAVLHGVGDLQAGHDLAGGEHLDLELAAGDVADGLGRGFGGAVDRVERLRKARGAAPLDGGRAPARTPARCRRRGCPPCRCA